MTASGETTKPNGPRGARSGSNLERRVLRACVLLVALAVGLSLAGRRLGARLAGAGYTTSDTRHEIVIGNNVLAVPANAIRFAEARRDGDASRLDLYLHWPDLEGYSDAERDDFNNTSRRKAIVFVSLDRSVTAHDMSGRMPALYHYLIEAQGKEKPAGVTQYAFRADTGYRDEFLAVARKHGGSALVARCLSGKQGNQSLAACQRDIIVGDGLRLTYRFSRRLLPQWRALDRAVREKMATMLQTG